MATDTIREREIELMMFLRTNIVDPLNRGTTQTDTFNGNNTTATFTLTKTLVKSIGAVSVASVAKYIGYDYTINLGEGTAASTITFLTVPPSGTGNISVAYKYGPTMIYEGFQREDATLPRIAIISKGSRPESMAIGDAADGAGGNYMWEEATYVAEIRSSYAKEFKSIYHQFANLIMQYRQQTPQPYRTIMPMVTFKQPLDFDDDLRLYRGQVVFTIKWQVKFK